ncbi:MAG TPA: hypothetical protein PKZ32_04160 [Candidatus Melainabacteria bacterium]|nr:hypothetical protein [Candidatus Melainabacteria bacterium]
MRRPLGSEYSFGCGGPLARTWVNDDGKAEDPAAGAGLDVAAGAGTAEPLGFADGDVTDVAGFAGGEIELADGAALDDGERGSLPSSGTCATAAKGRSKLPTIERARTKDLKW